MIGYMIEQELGNLLPFEVPFATLLTMVEVDPDDPGFKNPTKFVGPVYAEAEANRSRPRRAGRSSRTATSGAASFRRRSPSGSSRSGRSSGSWKRARSSSPRAAAASRPCTSPERRAARRRGGDRQGSLLGAAGPRARGRFLRHGDRCRRRLRRLGKAYSKAIRKASPKAMASLLSRPAPWGRRSKRRVASPRYRQGCSDWRFERSARDPNGKAGTTITSAAADIEWGF